MISPLSLYGNEKLGTDNVSPVIFTEPSQQNDDIGELESLGWQPFNNEGDKYF